MKKILSRIFSTALAAALVVPAALAAPQQAKKAKGAALAENTVAAQKALPSGLLQLKEVKTMTARTHATKGTSQLAKTVAVPSIAKSQKTPVKVQKTAGDLPTLIGSSIYSEDQTAYPLGLYKIPTAEGQDFELIASGVNAKNGGVIVNDTYWAVNFTNMFGYIFIYVKGYDVFSGEMVASYQPNNFDAIFLSATVDPSTGTVYAIGYNEAGNGFQLGTVEFTSSAVNVTAIAPFNYNLNTLACDATGQLYGITYTGEEVGEDYVIDNSFLIKIDKATAGITIINEETGLGIIPQYLSDGTIDPATNRFFWCVADADEAGYLTEVNLTAGTATPIYEFPAGNEIVGLQVLPPEAGDAAPAVATDASFSFPQGALTGTVKFTAPTTLYDGTAASGALSYKIEANGVVAEGTTSYGAEVEAEMTFTQPATYTFVITTSNDAGESPKLRVKQFIGSGKPATPNPTLAYADGTMTLTWEPISTAINAGYIDPEAITYNVLDSEGEVVAEGISATTWSTEITETEEIVSYTYSVVAINNGIESEAGTSNAIVLGSIIPPYENTFDTAADCEQFTVIDANGDGKTWTFYNGAMRVQYNSSLAMDDWLITAPMKLEANKAYYISFDIKSSSSYAEKFELCWGTEATAEAMTNVLIETTTYKSGDYTTFGAYLIPETSGKYYIGLHGVSDKDMFYLYVDNFSVSAGVSTTTPGAATDLVVTPAAYGSLFASISFNAPTKTFGGAELSEITKIEVSRDGEVIATKTNVAPGAAVKVADAVDASGFYTYSVVAYNADGAGLAVNQEVYIGVATPEACQNIHSTTEGNDITISWDAPAADIYGSALAPAQVTYNVYYVEGSSAVAIEGAQGISETSYTWTYEGEGQSFEQLAVAAVTEGGRSGIYSGGLVAVGPAYEGYFESFEDGSLAYILGTGSSVSGGAWGIYTDEDFSDISSYDGDNGYAGMKGQYLESSAMLFTGKISLAGIQNPALTLYTYVINGDNPDINEITISVCEPNTYEWTEVKTVAVNTLGEEGWCKLTASLADYEGQTIQLGITATTKQYVYTMVDAIKVGAMLSDDLKAKSIAAPSKVAAGNDFDVTVTIQNEGANEATAYTVELYGLGASGYALVDTKPGDAIAADASATVTFTQSVSPLAQADDVLSYYAKVVYAADLNADNDVTESVTVTPVISKLPAATELKGEATNEGNALTWNEPDLTAGVPDPVTDDIEDGESWAHEYKDWIFVDVDEAAVGGFQGTDIPGITPGTSNASWFVFDASGEQFNQTFAAASGDKYLATLFRYDDGTIDDWAISPALEGSAQTISFKAKSYSTQYPDAIEVYYSTGSTDVNDFVQIGERVTLGADWTTLEYDLPAGAKRFALRSCATSSFMLMLDDITYIPGDAVADLTLVGYDVYRDGVKLNEEVVAETTYVDTTAEKGAAVVYNVVAIYTTGASAPSNSLTLTTSALDGIYAGVNITAGKGEIVITGAEGLAAQVVAVDGKTIYAGVAEAKTVVAVLPGVYVVKAGDKVVKLIVR